MNKLTITKLIYSFLPDDLPNTWGEIKKFFDEKKILDSDTVWIYGGEDTFYSTVIEIERKRIETDEEYEIRKTEAERVQNSAQPILDKIEYQNYLKLKEKYEKVK